MTNKNKILISLALIWVVLIVYHLASPGGFFYLGGKGENAVMQKIASSNVDSLPVIDFETLEKKEKYKKTSTDLFYKKKKKYTPKPKITIDPVPIVKEKTPFEHFIETVAFAGFVQKVTGQRKKAFFIDYNEEIFIVKEGDLIVNRFKITGVTDKNVYFQDVKTKEQGSILIGEKD